MPVATEPRPATLPLPGGSANAGVCVHPLLTGEMHAPPSHTAKPSGHLAAAKIAAQLLGPRRRWNWLPVPAFLVEHPTAGPILIDTGLHPVCASDISANMGRAGKLLYEVRMEHDQALRFQLPANGVQPAEVRYVILTHLHVDHASAVVEFPESTFLVDRREWQAASEQGFRQGYHQRQFDHAFEWRLLDYNSDLVHSFAGFGQTLDLLGDGSVRLLSTPGHTPGHQSVLLRMQSGEVLLVGDAAYTERELGGQDRPMVVADEHLRRRSIREIQRYRAQTPDATVILSHDWLQWPELRATYE